MSDSRSLDASLQVRTNGRKIAWRRMRDRLDKERDRMDEDERSLG